jgi:amino acid transporter
VNTEQEAPAPTVGRPEPAGAISNPEPARSTPSLPESVSYQLKNVLFGKPLHTEALADERLGVPTALAVFSSDCISSSAYATEAILAILVPAAGIYAFSLVVPVTLAMIVVLVLLVLSYRQTVKEYPTAGGSYMVSRDNFGPIAGLVAGTSLLIGYTLTVAVSAAAGVAAITSLAPALVPYRLLLAIAVVWFITLVNLRGAKDSGKIFMVPTYLFIAAMVAMLGLGVVKLIGGFSIPHATLQAGAVWDIVKSPNGKGGAEHAFLYGAGLFAVLQAYATGGSAMTGVEAISNGVAAFKPVEWRNARKALIWMGVILGTFFTGLSFFSTKVHPVPYESGSPTVLAQVGQSIFGHGAVASGAYYFLQLATMLVLVLAANTSFADFPRLASFAAEDAFLPRQLTKRGHRLVFSNGIISLAVTATVLLLVTNATVNALIPLYAVGVFLSFTMNQAGMTKHHWVKREAGWRKSLVVNGVGCVMSAIVFLIILVTQFLHGAWVVVVAIPVLIALFVRLNRQYAVELEELANEAEELAAAPILRRHVVIIMVDKLSRAVARAIQYARSLTPDEIRAVHFALDDRRAREIEEDWQRLGLARIALTLVECPDRRVARAALEAVAEETLDGDTEVTVLIPRIEYRRFWHRLLHDRTGTQIAEALADLPHANVTIVPYHLSSGRDSEHITAADVMEDAARGNRTHEQLRRVTVGGQRREVIPVADLPPRHPTGETPALPDGGGPGRPGAVSQGIKAATFRQSVSLEGRVKAVQVQPWGNTPTLEVTLADEHGTIRVVFLGRRSVPGIEIGKRLRVTGVVGQHKGRLAMLNPQYQFL